MVHVGAYNSMVTPVRSAQSGSGDHLDRGGRHLTGLLGHAKYIDDPEANYLIPYSPSQWFHVAKVSIKSSFFQIRCCNQGDAIYFRLDFAPDPMKHARFSAALFHVEFSDTADITISKISPVNLQGEVIEVENIAILKKTQGFMATHAGAGIHAEVAATRKKHWIDKTSLQVQGWGADSLDARWSFSEDKVSRSGLNAQHLHSVNLAGRTSNNTTMRFWAEAKLESRVKKSPVKEKMVLGSKSAPYMRCLASLVI